MPDLIAAGPPIASFTISFVGACALSILLVSPVEISGSFQASSTREVEWRLQLFVAFLNGSIKKDLLGGKIAEEADDWLQSDGMAARASEGAAKDRAVGGYRAGARALLGEAELMSRIIRLLRDVISALELSIDGIIRFGFPDPSDTGRIYGYFCMLLPLIGKNCELHVHPMFQEELLEASISCSFSVCPYHLALLIGGFLFDFSNWQAAKRLLIQGKRARPKGG